MKKVTLSGNTYDICDSWQDITVIQMLIANSGFPFAEEPTKFEQTLWNIASLSNIPTRVLSALTIAQITELSKLLEFANVDIPKIENTHAFTFEGVEYECANPFDQDMLGKWITVEYMIMREKEIMESLQNGELNKLPLLIATLVHPKGEVYRSNDIEKRKKAFERLPVLTAIGVRNFFLQKLSKFRKHIRPYTNMN